jgi:carbon monoxide dehydrogenase subunit G
MTKTKKILIIVLTFPITLTLYIFLFTGNIKYTEEIEINTNIDSVITLFDNPYNMQKYMEGIESYKVVEGNIREVGAKAEMTVLMGDKKIIMIEEIITNNLPEEKKVTYTADGVYNIVTNRLVKISESKTKFINEQEFEFKGYMKVIGFFIPSAFKKQSRVYLKDFKEFAENQ